MAAQKNSIKVVTGKVRLSFCNLFTPRSMNEGGPLKYSVSILIPKSDTAMVDKFNKAFEEARNSNAAFFGGSVPKGLKGGLRDGDEERDDEAYAGHYFVNANSDNRPQVVDADMNEILDPNEVYSGCYGRVSVNLYPYNTNGAKGIACGLQNVMKLEDGEKLSGGSTAAQDFAI